MSYPFARCSAGHLSKVTEIRNDFALLKWLQLFVCRFDIRQFGL